MDITIHHGPSAWPRYDATGRPIPFRLSVPPLEGDRLARLLRRELVETETGCWTVTRCSRVGRKLYPAERTDSGARFLHVRAATFAWLRHYRSLPRWRAYTGPVGGGRPIVLDHECDQSGCVRPDHLTATTNRSNSLRHPGRSSVGIAHTQPPPVELDGQLELLDGACDVEPLDRPHNAALRLPDGRTVPLGTYDTADAAAAAYDAFSELVWPLDAWPNHYLFDFRPPTDDERRRAARLLVDLDVPSGPAAWRDRPSLFTIGGLS